MVARILTAADVQSLAWEPHRHKPTLALLARISEPVHIPIPGDTPNLNLEPGDVLASDGVRCWRLTGAEAEALYEPASLPLRT